MAKNSEIQYVDSTVNVVPVCSGCELWAHGKGGPCFAGNLIDRYKGLKGWPTDFGKWDEKAYYPERIAESIKWNDLSGTVRPDKPWLNGMPRIIFLNDLGDIFAPIVPMDVRLEILDMVSMSKHYYMVFTKVAKSMAETFNEYGIVPLNVMPVVSITSNMSAPRSWLFRNYLLATVDDNANFGISFEPLMGDISYPEDVIEGYTWVTVGGMSKQAKIKDAAELRNEWANSIVKSSKRLGIPVFVKQLGYNFVYGGKREVSTDNHNADFDLFPENLRVREMFKVVI